MKKVYICSPYRADTPAEQSENITNALIYCRAIADAGDMPLAPHLYFTCFLNDDDPAERGRGLNFAAQWIIECDEFVVFGDRVSSGMAHDIHAYLTHCRKSGAQPNIFYRLQEGINREDK
ncbi:hypothetical protein FACS1894208_11210 [Clostridia bacterium]|nr:hypothetical protein FACS1894208_11210 [Clostridia bacterium]